jgi:multidrug efflux pump subunit AcrA (membrane-fusion protein)
MYWNTRMFVRHWRPAAVAGFLLLNGLGAGGWWVRMGGLLGSLGPVQAAETPATEKKEKKILYWKSPMDPTYISKAPGKDSMGMELAPVYEGEEGSQEKGVIEIDPVTIQNIGVKTATVERRPLSRVVRTVGRIDYDETKVRKITPKIGGWIEKQHVDFTGQVVKKGERLLEIYSPELVSTQEEYLRALQFREVLKGSSFGEVRTGAENLVESTRTRLLFWDITPQQIRALEEQGTVFKTMTLHAPFAGIVVKKEALEGGYVRPGQDLYTLADLSQVWVYADIYEYEASWIRPGQEAEMTLSYLPGQTYKGKVVYVYPYLKNMTRTLQIRMVFPNSKDFALKPDMWADVVVRSTVTRNGLAAPIEAVLRTGKRNVAFVALSGGKFAPRELRLGAEVDGFFEVLDGLKEGERIVTSAQFLINSESSLQAAIQQMLEGEMDGGPSQEKKQEKEPSSAMEQTPGMSSNAPAQESPHGKGVPSERGGNKPMSGLPGSSHSHR